MAQDSMFKIVIVGGGIAGLASAIGLRGPNRQITVLEKSRMNKEVGALISFQPNAQKIIEAWDLLPFLDSARPVSDTAFRIIDINGEVRMSIPLVTEKYGADRTLFHRVDLHEALKKAAVSDCFEGSPAIIKTASEVLHCDCEEGIVTLADGTTVQGDLIIGADGIKSAIRNEVLNSIGEGPSYPKPTGLSAYRVLLDTKDIPPLNVPEEVFHPSKPVTTMMMAYDKRVIMAPSRGGDIFGLVCLVPDKQMDKNTNENSWTTPGSVAELLEQYKDFPEWLLDMYRQASDVALWQLRDIDPIKTWIKGRTVVIGDAAHAMLPTQGQGASQSIEDAEALKAFFADIKGRPSKQEVEERLKRVFDVRYERATLIQTYSRQQAGNATKQGEARIHLNPAEFMDYNCAYGGAVEWEERQGRLKGDATGNVHRTEGVSVTAPQKVAV